ncbi:hypothetical protein EJB05_03900 [Eragrostis curvula]|uniref:BRCT domain-containing protein n=1 Tax=Eragrostis curvula TaxID=38414 RepID=A0A5J9W952_9POAL|nr:hypothetical protein EJB05_03900 [Eragrostis curvula]
MSACCYHSPRFSEEIIWLPQWLQPYRPQTVDEHQKDEPGVPSPCCENFMFIRGPSQEHQNCQNAMVNAGGDSGFTLHLSGDEDTVGSTPISSNVQSFSLHLSSESAAELSPVEGNDNPQILNSGTCKGPLKSFCVDDQERKVDEACQNHFGAKDLQNDLPDVCKGASKEFNKPLDANRHSNVSRGKADVLKLRNADVNDAIELSVAASEAMVIAEMMLDDTLSNKLAEAAVEAALHVKEARKQLFDEELQHACGFSENYLDETDWLAELDEDEMVDVFQDVGLSLIHITRSSQDLNTGDLKLQNSQPSCPPCGTDTHILGNCSSEKQNNRWNSQNEDSNDHVSDSLAISRSANVLPNEPNLCYNSVNQGAPVKTILCSGNKKTDLQVFVQNSAALHGSLAARVTNDNIHKESGRVAAQMNVGKKIVKGLFQDETSFIPESISSDECRSTSGAASMEIIASSRASVCCKTEVFREENQDAESLDPLCSFVPCSVSCDEGHNSQAPVYKQSEGNSEYGINQPPECEQSKGKEKEFMYPNESPKFQDPDGEAGPSSVALVKSPEINVTSRRRQYGSLRPFSTIAPKSNLLEATSTHNADVEVCRPERFTPITLNKCIQHVQAAKQSMENEVEARTLQVFSKFQKKPCYSQDSSKHQITEQEIPQDVCQQAANLNVGKQYLKRKRVQFAEAKVSSRRTKNSRRMLTKSRFSRSDGRIGEILENSENIKNKEAIFQGVEFLLTGFQRQKEKEIESLIHKFGGHVLYKVPLFPLDKRKNMAEFQSWEPPIVLSPRKVSTAKFLYGCAMDAWTLHPNWLFDSVQAGVLLPPGKYVIRQRKALKHCSAFEQLLHPKCNALIFDGVGFLIHGKITFCSKFSNIIKHGGGQVFMSLQGLVESLKDGSTSHGIILVANEASAPRHLSHCGLEHDIKTAPANWIIDSLYSGKLIPLKKDRCASFRRIKMPSFQQQHVFVMSQEI